MKTLYFTLAVAVFSVVFAYMILLDKFEEASVKHKRIIITGASTGIGEQLAYKYAQLGAKILIVARREWKLKQVIEKCDRLGFSKGDYHHYVADMSHESASEAIVQEAQLKLGGIDYLILNHITEARMGFWVGSAKNFSAMHNIMNVNFVSYVQMTSSALPLLEESNGKIVVVSSVAGRIAMPYTSSYCASKFALEGFFSSLRQELKMKNSNVTISVAVIGKIGTENADKTLEDFGLGHLQNAIPGSDPADAAMAIIKGASLSKREIFFPYTQARLSTLVRDFVGPLLEWYTAQLYTK